MILIPSAARAALIDQASQRILITDGAFGTEQTPLDVNSIADLARLRPLLQARGYSAADVDGIMHGNFVRFLRGALK